MWATATDSSQLEIHLRNQALFEGSSSRRNQGHPWSGQENPEILPKSHAGKKEEGPIHPSRESNCATKRIEAYDHTRTCFHKTKMGERTKLSDSTR